MRLRVLALVLSLFLLAPSPGRVVAQQAQSALQGTVRDQEGQVVRGATVIAASGAGERATLTDSQGRYRLAPLPAGQYTIRVQAVGYRSEVREVRVAGGGSTLDLTVSTAPVGLDPLEVVGVTRSSIPVAAVPGAITVVKREQIEEQADISPRLGAILSQLVPGLAAGTETVSNYGQNLRGRTVLVLIDGVPQSTSRNVTRDFVNIDPAMVERVEVIRGATSIYGDGATGGVINVITRKGAAGRTQFSSSVGTEVALSAFGEAVGPRVSQRVSGSRGAFDYVLGGSFTETAGVFDAEGDRVPSDPTGQGGVADTRSYDFLGKLGYSSDAQRLQLTTNYFRSEQDTDFATAPTVGPDGKASAIEGLQLERGQGSENLILNLEYTHASILGSELRAQAYHRQYETTFRPGDFRSGAWSGRTIFQSYVDSEKTGGRLEVETPLLNRFDASLLWGADYTDELTSQPVYFYDPAAYDASGGLVFRQTGNGVFVPPIDTRSLGLFAQLAIRPMERLMLRGGVRHERAAFEVDDFTALNGVSIAAGTLDFAPALFNVGAVVEATEAVQLFANFSQGFSLADLGRVIRIPPPGFTLGSREAQAQRVDQVEAGVRGAWNRIQASATAFRNSSELGTSLGRDLEVVRAPERVYGMEFTLDTRPIEELGLGGTLSWVEGEFENTSGEGTEWVPLNTFRIQPMKLTGYVEHRATARWRNRLQLLYSGARDHAFEAFVDAGGDPAKPGFGLRAVEAYTVLDLLSTVDVGPGTLDLGVRNLLNNQYFPVVSQLMPIGPASYSAAPGATFSVGYTVSY
jgi:iron complex outermembrane receptor protein